MASFTDLIPQFNPYIQQLPVEAMVQVGMEKQKRYDEGIQKLQSQIDQVAGLSVLRSVDKAYLQSRLNELGNNLRTVAAGDFSNFQLVNSVGGMIGQISKDPFVMAAVKSTAQDQKNLQLMEDDRKAGKLTPQNELNYSKQKNKYLQSGLKDENGNPITFSGSYDTYFDYWKYAKETFDAMKPDGLTFDQVYETDANGIPKVDKNGKPIYSPVMVRYEKEGLFPNKVKEALTQIFSDPRVAKQLQIDGEYNYRNVDGATLATRVRGKKEESVAFYEDQIGDLSLKLSFTKDPKEQSAIQENIDKYKRLMQETQENYDTLERTALEDPDAIRGLFYKNEVSDRYTTMFGYVKEKKMNMENPGWNANFKLMQEANAQSRWAQDFAFKKQQHADAMAWKAAEFEQNERLGKGKKGKGKPGEGDEDDDEEREPEQGDQSSAFDILRTVDRDNTNFANDFINASDDFIWSTVFSKNSTNIAKLDDLVKGGMTKEQAIATLINNAAKNSKQSPEEFRSYWGKKAEAEMTRLKASNQVTHDLNDAYKIYTDARRNYEAHNGIKKDIEDATERNIGISAAKALQLSDLKPEKVRIQGKEYNLSKEDIVDLAVYLKGYESVLGFTIDEGARNAAKAAAKRLEARGNKAVMESLLRNQGAYVSGGPISLITRTFGSPIQQVKDIFYSNEGQGLKQVMKVYDLINNDEYTNGIKVKADIARNAYGIRPNLKLPFLTGNSKTDKELLYQLRTKAGAYLTGQKQNLSYDFDGFAAGIEGDLADLAIESQVIMDGNGNPQVEIVAYDKSTLKRKGGMTVQPDEARNLGIDVNALYEPREVGLMRNVMDRKKGRTSAGDPHLVDTYIDADSWIKKDDLPKMVNTPFDAQVNFSKANGLYYGHIYINDGRNSRVHTTTGVKSLTELYTNIVTNTDPTWAKAILTLK